MIAHYVWNIKTRFPHQSCHSGRILKRKLSEIMLKLIILNIEIGTSVLSWWERRERGSAMITSAYRFVASELSRGTSGLRKNNSSWCNSINQESPGKYFKKLIFLISLWVNWKINTRGWNWYRIIIRTNSLMTTKTVLFYLNLLIAILLMNFRNAMFWRRRKRIIKLEV